MTTGLFRAPWSRSRRLAVVGTTVAVAATAGVAAYAAWSGTGAGTATAQSGTAQPLTTTVAASTTGPLYPNGPAGDVRIAVVNPNPYPVRVTQVAGAGPITAAGGTGACATHGVVFATRTGTWDVAANATATFTLAGAATMGATAENGCQNATFTIPVALTGASS